jgi:hypothetical protein
MKKNLATLVKNLRKLFSAGMELHQIGTRLRTPAGRKRKRTCFKPENAELLTVCAGKKYPDQPVNLAE